MRKWSLIFCMVALSSGSVSQVGLCGEREEKGGISSFSKKVFSLGREAVKIPIRGTTRLLKYACNHPVEFIALYALTCDTVYTLAAPLMGPDPVISPLGNVLGSVNKII